MIADSAFMANLKKSVDVLVIADGIAGCRATLAARSGECPNSIWQKNILRIIGRAGGGKIERHWAAEGCGSFLFCLADGRTR